MFKTPRNLRRRWVSRISSAMLFEPIEPRTLLSGVHAAEFHGFHFVGLGKLSGNTIEFSAAPAAVQTGLNTLAATDLLPAPTATQLVFLGNSKGVETYTIAGNSTTPKLTVDVNGTPVVATTSSMTTFGAVSDTAVTDEFNAIATALGLTAPLTTDAVVVHTASDASVTYTFQFSGTTGHHHTSVTLDADGNPVGNVQLPLSVFSTAIQTALTTNAPVGATALTPTSTVTVRTLNGVTSYSATYLGTGIRATVSVDNTGALVSLPTTSTVQFSTIPVPAQTELQTLATADGFVGTIDPTANVRAYDEANGTTIYTIKLPVSKTFGGGTLTLNVRVSSDQNGNPTVPPIDGQGDDHEGGFCGGLGFGVSFGSNVIEFNQAPAAVQTALTPLAATDLLPAPTPTQLVFLGNTDGVETYTIVGDSTTPKLTVDVNGVQVVAPTNSTTTFSAVTDTAVTTEITAIATALGLTAPAATDSVALHTASDTTVTYTYQFSGGTGHHQASVTLNANGDPIGNIQLPLSVFSTAIQTALTSNAPAGATALTPTSNVTVKTLNGVTTYSVTYLATGIRSTISVNDTGTLTSLPSTSTVQFSTIPAPAQTELQTLATADGFVGTIDPTANVSAYDEANGTTIYTIKVPVSKMFGGGSFTLNIRVSSDQNGNPTVPPGQGFGDDGGGECGGGGGDRGGGDDGEGGEARGGGGGGEGVGHIIREFVSFISAFRSGR